MNRWIIVYLYDGILLIIKKEQTTAIHNYTMTLKNIMLSNKQKTQSS